MGKGAHTWWSLGGGKVSLKKKVPRFPHIYGDKTGVGRVPHSEQLRNDKVCETQGGKKKIPN